MLNKRIFTGGQTEEEEAVEVLKGRQFREFAEQALFVAERPIDRRRGLLTQVMIIDSDFRIWLDGD